MTEAQDKGEDQKKVTGFLKNLSKEKEAKTSEFIGAIIANIIVLYIVNNLLSWNLSFILPSFQDVLWIFNISICATIAANIIFLIYHAGWFRSIVQIILNILGFLVCYYLYTIFPFIFSNSAYTIALKILIILGIIALVIATLVEILRLVLRISQPF